MLALPTYGFSQPIGPSFETDTIELSILCDWIEGSVLFDQEELSTTDIVDILMAENIYANQDMASAIVASAWNESKRRLRWIGDGNPFSFIRRTIRSKGVWEENPAYSFCILLSMPQCYTDWKTSLHRGDYSEQGRLFELLTKGSIENQFLGWEVHQTGWSGTNTVKLSEIVDKIAGRLGEITGSIEPWANPNGKDEGLDLLCYRPFPDNRGGFPVYLMQCASGKHWIDKIRDPNFNIWTKMIFFTAKPGKAFAIPFVLSDKEFKNRCNRFGGLLFDRYRLLAAANHNREWISDSLGQEIIDWVTPRLQTLPRYDE